MKDSFKKALEEAVQRFKSLDTEKNIVRIISHLDCDGICAASILVGALKKQNIKFAVSTVRQLTDNKIKELTLEDYNIYIFSDLGSGQIKSIQNLLKNKTIFVLDHHQFEDKDVSSITHVNPLAHSYNHNDISGSGVSYLFAKTLDKTNKEFAYLAIIGAIGDIQENKGFTGPNNDILNDAVENNTIKVTKGLRMFGTQTKPIYRLLQYSTDPYIPGVTGSEQGALEFLSDIGVGIKNENGGWKKIIDLNADEVKKLVTGIILTRLGSEEESPDDVLGNIYTLEKEEVGSPTRDAKEFSTLLNCCGRMNKASLGIATCISDPEAKQKAIYLLNKYKKEIINSLNWFYKNRKTKSIIEGKNYVIINAEDNVRDTLIGTLASIISKSNIYNENNIIISLAHTIEGETKISIRLAGQRDKDIDLREILMKITYPLGYTSGGHKFAAGCVIPQSKETTFIEKAVETLDKNLQYESFINTPKG